MNENKFKQFVEAVVKDADLQKAWKEAELSYNGDKDDRVKVINELLIPFAESKGFSFTLEDVMDVNAAATGKLEDSELEAVSGGIDWCFIVGGDFEDCGCVICGLAASGPLCTILGQ